MDALDPILKLVGSIVIAGGGLSLIIYQIFKHFAVKWLDARFEERLQALKHDQQKEIEQLRYKISALLDRAVKLHQREFDVLPEAWAKLNDAYWFVRSLVSSFQSYPDIDRMNPAQLSEFIGECHLHGWQKDELKQSHKKNDYYQKAIFWHNLTDAKTKSSKAYRYLIKNGIFIKGDIRQELNLIHDLTWAALSEHEMNEAHDVIPRHRENVDKLAKEGDEKMKVLERQIHSRLWPATNGS